MVQDGESYPDSATGAFLQELKSPGSLALLFLATTLSLVTVFVLPEWKVPAQWPAIIAVLWASFAWLAASALRRSVHDAGEARREHERLAALPEMHSPAVITAMQMPGQDGELVLLLQPNRLFGQSMLVSIYHEDDRGFEILVANGLVTSVQGNGRLQVTVNGWEQAYEHVKRQVLDKTDAALRALIVRPAPTTVHGRDTWGAEILQRLIQSSQRESTDD